LVILFGSDQSPGKDEADILISNGLLPGRAHLSGRPGGQHYGPVGLHGGVGGRLYPSGEDARHVPKWLDTRWPGLV
jgi:hypothetical protein